MDVRQNQTFLAALVKDVKDGRLFPAGMQRPYVWQQQDVMDLCDSIINGFPVGDVMTWTPAPGVDLESVSKPRLGPIFPEDNARGTSLILDGQNRLATIAWTMRPPTDPLPDDMSDAEYATWGTGEVLVVDGEDQKMVFVPEDQVDRYLRLPASAIFEGGSATIRAMYGKWEDNGYSDDQIGEFLNFFGRKVEQSFLHARVIRTDFENATPDEARHAFLRMSRAGVPMSEEDFQAAVDWLPGSSAPTP